MVTMTDRRASNIVRLSQDVVEKAMREQPEEMKFMDKGSWLSYLVVKGLEKVKEEKAGES